MFLCADNKLTARQSRSLVVRRGSIASPLIAVVLYDLCLALSEADVSRVKQWTAKPLRATRTFSGSPSRPSPPTVPEIPRGRRIATVRATWVGKLAGDRTSLFQSTWAFAGCTPAPVVIECYPMAILENLGAEEYVLFKKFVHKVHHVVQDQIHRDHLATRSSSSAVRPIGPD